MSTLENIGYNLILDDSGFRVTAQASSAQLKALEAQFESTGQAVKAIETKINSAGVTFHQWVTTIGAVKFALMDLDSVFLSLPKAILETSGEIEKLQVVLKGLSSAATDAGRAADATLGKNFILNLEQNVPFKLQALTDTFVKFKTVGIDPMKGSMTALLNEVAKYGGGSEQLKSASLAIQQMAGKGVVSLQELRMQLSQAVPGAAQAMATGMGMTMGELTKAISKGTVSSEMAIKKMLAVFANDSAGAGAAQMQTWLGTLEKLNTRWDLFKMDVADSGFFKATKDELNDIMGLFGTPQAHEWAKGLSDQFVSMIGLFHEGRTTLQEYLPQLLELGKVVLAAFSVTVVASWLNGTRNALAGIVTAYREYAANAIASEGVVAAKKLSVTEQILAADQARRDSIAMESELRQEALAREIAANQQLMVANDKRYAAIDAARQAEYQKEIEGNAKVLAAKIALFEELTAAEAGYSAALLAEQYKRAQMGMASNSATAAEYAAQARLTEEMERGLVSFRAEIALLEKEAVALTERNNLLRQAIAEETAATAAQQELNVATSAGNAALVEANAALAAKIAAERRAIANMTEMTFGAAALKTGIMGLQFAFNALGGWIGLVSLAIIGGIALWDKYRDHARAAAQAAADAANIKNIIAKGDASQKTVDNLNDTLKNKQAEISLLESQINQRKSGANEQGEFIGARGEDDPEIKAMRAKIALLQKGASDMKAARDQAQGAVDQQNAALNANKFASKYEQDSEAALSNITANSSKLNAERQQAFEKRTAGMKKDSAEYIALQKQLTADNHAAQITATDERVKVLTASRDRINAAIAAGFGTGKEAQAQAIAAAREQKRLTDEIANAQGQGVALAAPNEFVAPKNNGGHTAAPTDFLEKSLDHVKVQLAGATEQLRQIQTGATDYEQLRKGVELQVKEMVDAGQLDYVTHGKGGGKSSPSMSDPRVQELIDDKTALEIVTKAKEQLAQIKKKLAPAEDELKRSLDLLASGDYTTKPGANNERMLNYLDKIHVTGLNAAKAVASITEEERKLLLVAPTKDLVDYTRGLGKDTAAINAQLIQNKRDQLEEEFRIAREAWEKEDAARLDAVRKLGGKVDVEQAIIEQRRAVEHASWLKKMETPMEQLAQKWGDTTNQMENASTGWANSTIDTFVSMVTTGKMQFGKLLEGIATDMLKISLQKSMGGGLQQMFDGLTKGFVGVIGGNGKNEGRGTTAAAEGAGSALPAMLKGPLDAVGGMFTKLFGAGEHYSTTLEDNVKNLMVVQTTETTTQNSLMTLGQAAQYAAAALSQIQATSGGGGGIGGALGSIAGALASAYFGGAGSATEGMLSQTASMQAPSTLMGVQGGTNTLGNWNYTGGQMSSQYKFADGGIMTEFGPMSLRKYANGGIADSPQVAVYGEGSMNEAFVPLPDGRSIPVTITGGQQQQQSGGAGGVVVNVINQTGQSVQGQQQGSPRFDGQKMILDVVLTAASQPGSFRDGMKGALK
jgi:tape measure domain-containing protein